MASLVLKTPQLHVRGEKGLGATGLGPNPNHMLDNILVIVIIEISIPVLYIAPY